MTDKNPPSSFPDDLDADPGYSMDRLISLGDGIFAFAMTLLAINVDIPQLAPRATPEEITSAVVGLAPQLFIYVTSFLLVALYWQVNRRVFHYIVKSDILVSWLFILQLMFVAFLPVATGLFDTHPGVPVVIFVYTGTLTAIGLLGQALFSHARRARLIDPSTSEIQLDYFSFRGIFTTFIYLVVMITGVFATDYARYFLFILLAFYPFLKHIFRVWYNWRHKASSS